MNQAIYGQSLNDVFSSSDLTAWIKIIEPIKAQSIEIGQDVEITGEASAGISKNCHVLVIVNNVKSSQNAIPVHLQGNDLVSQWKFVIHGNDELFNEGKNTITSKLYCPNSEIVSSKSVMLTGVKPAQIESKGLVTTTTKLDQTNDYNASSRRNGFNIVAAGDYGCNPVTRGNGK